MFTYRHIIRKSTQLQWLKQMEARVLQDRRAALETETRMRRAGTSGMKMKKKLTIRRQPGLSWPSSKKKRRSRKTWHLSSRCKKIEKPN